MKNRNNVECHTTVSRKHNSKVIPTPPLNTQDLKIPIFIFLVAYLTALLDKTESINKRLSIIYYSHIAKSVSFIHIICRRSSNLH